MLSGVMRPDCPIREIIEYISGLWPPQFVVSHGQNISEVTDRLFKSGGHHSLLYHMATTFERSQIHYSKVEVTTICRIQRPEHLKTHTSA